MHVVFVTSWILCYALGADIHAQTEETQETALSLACCGGFQDVAAFLLQAGILLFHELTLQFCQTKCQMGNYSLIFFLLK